MPSLSKIPTPFGQRLKRARIGALPLAIWLGGVLLAMNLWLAGPSAATFYGLAHSAESEVTLPVDGAVDRVLVGLYETVSAGDPLATLDTAVLEARVNREQAELEQLAAEVRAQRASLAFDVEQSERALRAREQQELSSVGLDHRSELRAFYADEADLEVALLRSRLAITVSELEADRLEVNLLRLQTLAFDGLQPQADIDDLTLQLAAERARASGQRQIEARTKSELEQARVRRQAFLSSGASRSLERAGDPAVEERLAGWKAAVLVQQRRLEELDRLRAAHVLRAPTDGRVAALFASEGQFLLAGDALLVLVDGRSRDVALWVPELCPTPPKLGDRFRVARRLPAQRDAVAECVVQSMSPRLELMPKRLWRDVQVAEYGRACLLGPVLDLALVPGEQVHIDPVLDAPEVTP